MILVSVTQAAHAFSVHPKTMSEWAKSGKVPAIKQPNGVWKFDAVTLAKYMAENGYPEEAIRGLMQ